MEETEDDNNTNLILSSSKKINLMYNIIKRINKIK